MDAAGVDKQRLAAHVGFPAPFGQSQFAITRGNAFEAQVKAERRGGAAPAAARAPGPADPGGVLRRPERGRRQRQPELRHARTRQLLTRAAAAREDAGTLFDHPLLQPGRRRPAASTWSRT